MKKLKDNKKVFVWIILITFFASIPLFIYKGLFTTPGQDLIFHLSRIDSIADALKNGIKAVYVYPNYYYNYGYALGIFYPSLFLYIPAIICKLGLNLINSYKIFIIIINFFTAASMYFCLNRICKDKKISLYGTFLYTCSSYHLVDLYVRSALAESLSFIFFPLIILGIYEIIYEDKNKFYILAIGMSGIVYSHIISIYLAIFALVMICLFNLKRLFKEKRYLYIIFVAILCFLLTAAFTVPFLEQILENKFMFGNYANRLANYLKTTPFFTSFFEIKYEYLVSKFIPNGLGIIFLFYIVLQISKIELKNNFKNICFFIGILSFLLAVNIFDLSISKYIFCFLQFSYRFYILITLFLVISFCIFIKENKQMFKHKILKRSIVILSIIPLVIVYISLFNSDKYYELNELFYYEAGMYEYIIEGTNLSNLSNETNIKFKNEIDDYTYDYSKYKTIITIKNNEYDDNEIEVPLFYYKGYTAIVNGKSLKVEKSDNNLVLINIGDIKDGKIVLEYKQTKAQKTGIYVSLFTLIIFIITLFYKKKDEKII